MMGTVDRDTSGLAETESGTVTLGPMISFEAVGLLAVALLLVLLMAREFLLAYLQQERVNPRRVEQLHRVRRLLQALAYPSMALLSVFLVLAGIEYANAL
ncbi:MAG: hypothetical protein ACPGQL_03790 [Thermoplasmatota archaeon]